MKEPKKGTGKLSKIRKKPGESNAFKYEGVKEFAGTDKTFPINTESRARNALSRAHFSPTPGRIRTAVYKKYPDLKKRHEDKEHGKK